MSPKIVIVIPVLRRPHRAQLVINSILETTPIDVARVLFVATPGDDAEIEACRATGADVSVLGHGVRPGDYARKINSAYLQTDEPLIFLGADDLQFHHGWYEAIVPHVEDGFGVIGTNDLGNSRVMRGEHATHCVVTREYVDEFGTIDKPDKILHEQYVHEYCDDELVGTAKFRNKWSFAPDSIVEHLHPLWGKAPTDELYDAQQSRMRQSKALFQARRRLWS